MPNGFDLTDLKKRVADEVRGPFQNSVDPKYSFGPENAVETLFMVLSHRPGFPNLEGVGESILSGLRIYVTTGDVTILLVKMEPFAMLLLRLVDPQKHDDLWAKLSHENPPRKPTLASILKKDGLALATNASFNQNTQPEDLRGKPRFAEHVARVYAYRNPEAHEAYKLSGKTKAEIFESICVFLIFAVSEYRERIETALFVARHRNFLEKLVAQFGSWGQRFVMLHTTERKTDPLQKIDPLAHIPPSAVLPIPRGNPASPSNQSNGGNLPAPALPITDVVKQHRRLVLLGESGAGKTTSLNFLTWHYASELFAQRSPSVPLPVYLALKYYDRETGKNLSEMVREELGLTSIEVEQFLNANVVLLLDGLNEIRHSQQAQLVMELKDWLARHHTLKAVVTTRPAGYDGKLEMDCFEIKRLNDDQMTEFLGRSFSDPSQLAGFVLMLKKQPKLWEWGRNPLHLAMLASVVSSQGGEFPTNRGKLVQSFVRGFFRRECLQGIDQTYEITKENLLAYLAFEAVAVNESAWGMFATLQRLRVAAERLSAHVDVPKFIEEVVDNGLLLHRGDDELTFAHDMYRDYFTAVEIANRSELEPLLVEKLQADLRWEEPLILYSGITCERARVVEHMSHVNPLLAARSITSSLHPELALREMVGQNTEAAEKIDAKSLLAFAELGDLKRFGKAIKNSVDYGPDVVDAWIEILRRANIQILEATSEDEENGIGVQVANVLIETLFEKGAAEELFALGCLDMEDHPSTPILLTKCLEAAAQLGHLNAAYSYGLSLTGQLAFTEHKFGAGIVKNHERLEEAAIWLRRAADGGNSDAMIELSELLFDGKGLDKNPAEAEKWLRKAADAQSATAMLRLGIRLLDGDGLPRKRQEGEDWIRKAAEKGQLDAMHELATRLAEHAHGLAANPKEALAWLVRASNQEHAAAMRDYGLRLLEGDGIARNVVEGEGWLRKAAEAQDPFAVWERTRRLLVGDVLAKNLDEARGWVAKLAQLMIAPALWGEVELKLELPRNVRASLEDLIAMAELGHPRAMCILGKRLLEGRGVEKDEEKAEHWLRKAADSGDETAMFILAEALLENAGLPPDEAEGLRFLQLAAEHGHPFAIASLISRLVETHKRGANQNELSHWIERGLGKGVWVIGCTDVLFQEQSGNPEEGERLTQLAAKAGFTDQMTELGIRLTTGDGLTVDTEQGAYWLRKAARFKNVTAMRVLGHQLLIGKVIPRDTKEGEMWLRKAVQCGDASAMVTLAGALLDGDLLPLKVAEGERWLRKAAHKGDEESMAILGNRLLDGVGLKQNIKEGRAWLKKSADSGFLPAVMWWGLRLLDGNKVAKNPSEGEKWLRQAAEAGSPNAMFHLAEYIAEGEIPEQEDEEELVWLRKAAENKHTAAIAMLGCRLHAQGQTEEAETWLHQAITQGEHLAALLLAQCLFESGDRSRFQEAEKWLRHAARAGVAEAMKELGERLIEGNCMQKDEKEGREWLRMAADACNEG